jgi:hypothetical protein
VITYAIAVGAVERGRHYMEVLPGWPGWTFAILCTGVVFLAGARLLDSVKPVAAVAARPTSHAAAARHHRVTGRSRPRRRPLRPSSESRISRRRD